MNRVCFCSFKAQRFNKYATSNQALKTELAEGEVGKKRKPLQRSFFLIFYLLLLFNLSLWCVIINLRREPVSLGIPVQKKNICENPGIVTFTCQFAHGENVARLITKLLHKDFVSLQFSQLAQLEL